MTKDAFLQTLRQGLAGLPVHEIDGIVGDYSAHFADASGRGEAEVAAALGDPARLARELRAEAGLRRFEAHWSMSNMLAATLALAGLAFVDLVLLLPLLLTAIILGIGLGITLVAIGALGIKIILSTLLFDPAGTLMAVLGRLFIGAGLVGGFIGGGALLLLGFSAGLRVVGRYARLHSRLARPDRDRA
ncbi:DUF1700 domain-containing protein [Mesorhizobium sp. B2-6-2]|uniref:DUF1700 domain-containing protein n=1 Tax=Mesorhizobium sp. B2-6-2 TaxID=2589915 RepID=UPI00112CE74A|nr:DUF1700 domain-containing protein [Mesorhizobium sp. B2-6-2]TPJ82220.1 DUF1700 domain-containing protein [Mesorhizobium sp. B2-6-2]